MWGVFKDTEEKKAQAEKAVLSRAQKKGKLEKYGVVDLAAELKKFEEESEDRNATSKTTDFGLSGQELMMNFEHGLRKSKGVTTKQKSARMEKKGKGKGTKLGSKGKQLETVELKMTGGEYGYNEYENSPRLPRRREQKGRGGLKYRKHKSVKGQYRGRKEKKGIKERHKERIGGSGRKGVGERHVDRVGDSKSQLSHCGSELSDLHTSHSTLKSADHSDKQSVGSKCSHTSHSASVITSAQNSEKSDEFLTAPSKESSSHASHTSNESVHSASHSSSHGSGSTESPTGSELGSGGEDTSCSEGDSQSEEESSSDEDSCTEEESSSGEEEESQSEADSHSESLSSTSNSEESSNESSDTSPNSQSGGSTGQ